MQTLVNHDGLLNSPIGDSSLVTRWARLYGEGVAKQPDRCWGKTMLGARARLSLIKEQARLN